MVKKEFGLIKKAIDATHEFEKLMDCIDFNSYLEGDEKNKDIDGYDQYKGKLEECKNTIRSICNTDTSKEESISRHFLKLSLAKAFRVKARTQSAWKEEKRFYVKATSKLYKGLDLIPPKEFGDQKNKKLEENSNWLKVLYYNELAICYSGLAKSSMSLGYAELSTSLLEEIYPALKDIEHNNFQSGKDKIEKLDCFSFDQIIKLYTFALYNKGEAERLLHNLDSALKTFCRIIEICKTCNKEAGNNSDKISALFRKALILNDIGRGKEAIKALGEIYHLESADNFYEKFYEKIKKIVNDGEFEDYRMLETGLEAGSAWIDKKEYEKAYSVITLFTKDGELKKTFIERKAKVYLLRLMNEFKKNRPEDFEITIKRLFLKQQEEPNDCAGISYNEERKELNITLELAKNDFEKFMGKLRENDKAVKAIEDAWNKLHPDRYDEHKEIKKEYPEFKENAKKILSESSARKDGDNFKKTCTYLAEYYRYKIKTQEKALKCFCLYLYESQIFEESNNIIDEWLNEKSLDDFLTKHDGADNNPVNKLDIVEDERYLRNFFDLFLKYIRNVDNESAKKRNDIIEKLKDTLVLVYGQKGNDYEIGEVEKKYRHFHAEFINGQENGDPEEHEHKRKADEHKTIASEFIEKYFFLKEKDENKKGEKESIENLIRPNRIVERIKKTTGEFAEKVVGQSIPPAKNGEEIIGRLCVLRRWNSFTPTLRSSVNASKGGGYFLYFSVPKDNKRLNGKNTFGIVVDPGYNFLENFFSQGFKIGDIDVVLISHVHPDHTNDLPALLSLFHEMNSRLGEYHYGEKKNRRNFTLIISPGGFEHYRDTIKLTEEHFKDIIVVRAEEKEGDKPKEEVYESDLNKNKIKIHAFGTAHKDLSKSQSLGFKIIVKKEDGSETQIGFTGDAKWEGCDKKQWPNYLDECNIICAHLGAIVNVLDEKDFYNTFCKHINVDGKCTKNGNIKCKKLDSCVEVDGVKLEKQTRDENHLYLAGLASFFDFLHEKNKKLQIAIISEFGEELIHGMRMDLYKKFDKWFETELFPKKNGSVEGARARCLPGDIGLEIDVFKGNVYCHCCGRDVERDRIEPVPYGKEEAICFVCKECQEVLSVCQIGEKLKDYCENGRRLESKA